MGDKRRKSMVDLREFPAALDLARSLYRITATIYAKHVNVVRLLII